MLSRNTIKTKKAKIQTGLAGTRGLRRGTDGGARNESVVVSVAVQNAVAALVPAVGTHVVATESALLPFMNWTVPVGPAPWLVVDTVAVSITLPPEAILVTEAVRVVVVGCAPVTVKDTPLLATPPTVTTTLPVVAPVGTGATMLVALQVVGVVAVPLNVTVLEF